MQTSLIVLAALGVAVDARQSLRVEMSKTIAEAVPEKFDFFNFKKAVKTAPVCEIKPEDQMDTFDLIRNIKYTSYNAFVKNFYDTPEAHPISQECMGEWMKKDQELVWPVVKKLLKGHYFEIGYDEAKSAADALLEIIYKNVHECKWMEIRDDLMNLCLENKDQCIFLTGFQERVTSAEALWPLVSKGFDLWDLINNDDTCYSDKEQIHELERLVGDFAAITRQIYGFEGHLDLNKPHKSMSFGHFIHKVFKIVFREIKSEVHAIVEDIKASMPHFEFLEPAHHGHHGQHGENGQFGHWGENPMANMFGDFQMPEFKCPFSGQPMSFPKIDFPFFQPPHHQPPPQPMGNMFGRPDEMPDWLKPPGQFHFPNLADLHLF